MVWMILAAVARPPCEERVRISDATAVGGVSLLHLAEANAEPVELPLSWPFEDGRLYFTRREERTLTTVRVTLDVLPGSAERVTPIHCGRLDLRSREPTISVRARLQIETADGRLDERARILLTGPRAQGSVHWGWPRVRRGFRTEQVVPSRQRPTGLQLWVSGEQLGVDTVHVRFDGKGRGWSRRLIRRNSRLERRQYERP